MIETHAKKDINNMLNKDIIYKIRNKIEDGDVDTALEILKKSLLKDNSESIEDLMPIIAKFKEANKQYNLHGTINRAEYEIVFSKTIVAIEGFIKEHSIAKTDNKIVRDKKRKKHKWFVIILLAFTLFLTTFFIFYCTKNKTSNDLLYPNIKKSEKLKYLPIKNSNRKLNSLQFNIENAEEVLNLFFVSDIYDINIEFKVPDNTIVEDLKNALVRHFDFNSVLKFEEPPSSYYWDIVSNNKAIINEKLNLSQAGIKANDEIKLDLHYVYNYGISFFPPPQLISILNAPKDIEGIEGDGYKKLKIFYIGDSILTVSDYFDNYLTIRRKKSKICTMDLPKLDNENAFYFNCAENALQ